MLTCLEDSIARGIFGQNTHELLADTNRNRHRFAVPQSLFTADDMSVLARLRFYKLPIIDAGQSLYRHVGRPTSELA